MPRSRQEQKGATPLNSTVHPATRSVSKQITEADTVQSITDNFQQDIGLILLDNNTDSTTVSNNTDSGEESDIEDNISVNSNSSIISFNLDLDSEMASERCIMLTIIRHYQFWVLQLTGHASLWFHNLDANTKGNIDSLKAAFLARFSNTKTNQQIYKLQQTSIESSQAYLARVQQLAMGAENLGEAVIVDIAVNGLQPSLKQTVIQKSPKTFEELRNSLEIATNVAECASSNTPCTSQDINAMFSSFLESMKSAVKQEVSEVMAVTPHPTQTQNYPERQETRQYKQEYVCFGCGNKMQIEVCGKHVTSLVDTDAQMSCCSVQLLQFLGISKDKIEISKIKSAMGVGGEVHSVRGLVSLPLILGNVAMRYNFHVFDKLHQQMILGFDFLHDVKAHIICDSETIFIPNSCSNTLNALELNSWSC
ncbi:unnamed protein product [Mytilus coruscus]|uniref:Retrotransposon gag domain-containing protein n=1 Tax=Mytilus coruscus TaxID=42192 RepID=A0A6J8A709_MYTCO|nr:unnamed protein product [Mytilus coruscus]